MRSETSGYGGLDSSVVTRDLTTRSVDGTILRGRSWSSLSPRASLVIAHGLGEHGGSYVKFANDLVTSLGIAVIAFDFRGSGRSDGKRGFVRSYDELLTDLSVALGWTAREYAGLPRFLMGHSNGGLVAIRAVQKSELNLSGLILSNPSIRLMAVVPRWKLAVATVLRQVAPSVTLQTGLATDQLTRDPKVRDSIDNDPLRHEQISAPLFFGMQESGPEAVAHAGEIQVPTLLLLGEADPIIDPTLGRRFFEKLGSPDKTLRTYPEMRHEPINEIGREIVVGDIVQWLMSRIP